MLGARKCFELCGVVPLAVFLVVHVASYAGVLLGWQSFGVAARERVFLTVLEVLLVGLPLAFHAGYGLWLALSPLPRDAAFARGLGLRVSGVALLAFLGVHVAWLRWPLWSGERAPEDVHEMLVASLSTTSHGVPVVALVHLVGLGLGVVHLGLGLSRFVEGWGLAGGLAARRSATALSIVLFALGAASIVGLATGSALPRFLH